MKTFRERIYRHINATKIFVLSFCLVIIAGAILLSLPLTNVIEVAPFIDNLFVAVSATCVTGLVTVTPAFQYNILGQIVIMCLIQIGGLGLMTIIAIVVVGVKKKLMVKEKKALKDYLNKPDLSDFRKYLRTIYGYTFVVETFGALLLMIRFIPQFGVFKGIFNSFFISVSAFCNAGFDNFGAVSLSDFVNDPLVNFTIIGLIILGGLGFIVWFDYWAHHKNPRLLTLHTKIVILTSIILILSGTVLFFVFEQNYSLQGRNIFEQIMISLFHSVSYRTAGFSTIDFATSSDLTRLIGSVFMLIGGSPGSCAGGMKTTTFVIVIVAVCNMLKNGGLSFSILKRELPVELVMRAFTIASLYLFITFISLVLLLMIEQQDMIILLFEIASALGTVGLSCGFTPLLSVVGKIIIMLLMLIGRVGPITMVLFFIHQNSNNVKAFKYPKEGIILG